MDKDQADRTEQDPGSGTTIPQSGDGIGATSTSEKSTFEPEEGLAGQGGGAGPDGESGEKA